METGQWDPENIPVGLEDRYTKETVKCWSLDPKVPALASYEVQEKERKRGEEIFKNKENRMLSVGRNRSIYIFKALGNMKRPTCGRMAARFQDKRTQRETSCKRSGRGRETGSSWSKFSCTPSTRRWTPPLKSEEQRYAAKNLRSTQTGIQVGGQSEDSER